MNLASESWSFRVLQRVGVGLLRKAEQRHHLDDISMTLCTHRVSATREEGSAKGAVHSLWTAGRGTTAH